MLNRVLFVAGAGSLLALAGPASALEYCVTCESPPAMYRCVVDGTADGPGKDPTSSLHCISEMAKNGRHATCTVSRGAPFPCPGLTTIVQQPKGRPSRDAGPAPAAVQPAAPHAPDGDAAATGTAPEPQPPQADEPAKVPRTVEELAGQTVKSSQEGLQKAGEAIGGTAKKAGEQIGNAGSAIGNAASKTWACITSLFSACGSDDSEPPSPEHELN